jgi:DNA polymerase elongation subunit (family B)
MLSIRLGKNEYSQNNVQRLILEKLKKRGVNVEAGQKIFFVYTKSGPELPEYAGSIDIGKYKALLARSLFMLVQPLGITRDEVNCAVENERQKTINEYCDMGGAKGKAQILAITS